MKLPSWTLALPLITLPFTALAQSDSTCRPIAARLVQEALDRSVARRATFQADGDSTGAWMPRDEARRRPTADAPAPASPIAGASSAAEAPAPLAQRESFDDGAPEAEKAAKPKASSASRAAGADKKGPSSYSRTNTQEEAVDEGDIVKTNGRNIFHVSCSRDRDESACRNELRIYKSWPAERSQLIGRYPLGDGVQQIYLSESRVAVISRAQRMQGARTDVSGLAPGRDFAIEVSRVTMLDVADPAHPRSLGELFVEGPMVESRMIGARLILATRTPRLQLPVALTAEIERLAAAGVTDAANALARLDGRWSTFVNEDPGLPHLGNATRTAALYRCADLKITESGLEGELLNVAQIDLNGEVQGSGLTGLTAQTTLYASESSLYVASAAAIPPTSGWSSATMIRKIGLDGGRPHFVAQGAVRGTLLNQFALSEYAGHLRVATTDQWVSNNLYVLRTNQGELETVGRLENLGANERIYAVRMLGDRGYVVTFRRTDPLYTLDLSNPTRPALIGELKIDGYSNYLHPLGGNHLLAIGQDTDAAGRATGFHLQVFDVTDPRNPTRKFHHKLAAGSVSDAQSDHHAFFFEPTTNTLSVPWKSDAYWGLIAFRVDPTRGFVDLGRVNHALLYKKYFARQCAKSGVDACERPNHWYTFVTRPAIAVDRLLAIDDHLYSVSPSGLMVHRIGADRLTEAASVLATPPAWSTGRPPVISSAW